MCKPIENIGVIRESRPDENRTPLVPDHIEKIKLNYLNELNASLSPAPVVLVVNPVVVGFNPV